MSVKYETFSFFFPVVLLSAMALFVGTRLVLAHLNLVKTTGQPHYDFSYVIKGLRGSIFASGGRSFPLAQSIQEWEYRIDPKVSQASPEHRMEVIKLVSDALGVPFEKVLDIYARTDSRYIFLTRSSDDDAYRQITTNKLRKVSGVAIEEKIVRKYPYGKLLSQVIGFVSKDPTNTVGGAGLELRYEKYLKGTLGTVGGMKDARGREIRKFRGVDIDSQPGCDIYLTIDHNIQYEVERLLAEGLEKYKAEAAWAVVLEVKTGAVLALANLPDYEPINFNRSSELSRMNRVISECYEPGSVMKTITAAAALNEKLYAPQSMINTARNDSRYFRLPGDGSHKWEPFMSVSNALVHSSNIVFGKIGCDLGPKRLWTYFTAFGLGTMTGIELPGEETGIIPNWKRWDKVKWSRAPIGQGVAVTAIQMANAYAAIANDGKLMRPYLIKKIVNPNNDADNEEIYTGKPYVIRQVVSPEVAQQVREMMRGVAKRGGTARRAAIRGYSVAGKTGTAQMKEGKGYSSTNYNSSFIGMVPAGNPEVVILVTYQKPEYSRKTFAHQGGVCAAPTFKLIAEQVLRYMEIPPDLPEEIKEEDEDGF